LPAKALQRPIHFSFIPNDSIEEKLTLLTVEAIVSDVGLNLKTVLRVCGQWVLMNLRAVPDIDPCHIYYDND
jgi:hypothetical protein